MSQWAPKPEGLTQSEGPVSETSSAPQVNQAEEMESQGPVNSPGTPVRIPWWARLFPFCLSAFFFLSAFLVVFAPLPLIFLYVRKGRSLTWLAILTNSLIVGVLGGVVSLVFYLVWVATVALVLPELLSRKKSVEVSVVGTLAVMAIAASLFAAGCFQIYHINPIHEIRNQVSSFVDYLNQSVSANPGLSNSGLMNPADMDDWKKSLFIEFPSAMAIFSLVIVWANLTLLLRANPNGIRERLGLSASYLKSWKSPQFLVWLAIASGFFLVVNLGVASDVALNVFKFIMAVYAIQGLSVLSYFFDMWNIRGMFRLLGYSLSLFLMMPLVLSLGFFDLWFDFRGKFRQS